MPRATNMKDVKDVRDTYQDEPAEIPAPAPSPRVAISRRQLLGIAIVLVLLAGTTGTLAFKVISGGEADQSAQVSAAETKALVEEIGKIMVLPSDEEPTVATVSDLEPLKDQPFFANAKIGDKVLIYTNARKAILYNPKMRKIVEVAPINIGDQSPADTAPAEDSKE